MPFLTGGFANLDGYRVGSWIVQRLVGRDRAGLPSWELACTACDARTVLGHRKVVAAVESGAALACTSGNCPSNRVKSESFTEFRRRERLEKEQAERAAADAAAKAKREAAERRTKEAQAEALKAEYREFFHHQMVKAGVFDELIPKWERWVQLPTEDRARIMTAIRQRPDVKVEIN